MLVILRDFELSPFFDVLHAGLIANCIGKGRDLLCAPHRVVRHPKRLCRL